MESTIIISTIIVTSLLWQTTEVYGKLKCFNTHTDTVETLNLTVSTCKRVDGKQHK